MVENSIRFIMKRKWLYIPAIVFLLLFAWFSSSASIYNDHYKAPAAKQTGNYIVNLGEKLTRPYMTAKVKHLDSTSCTREEETAARGMLALKKVLKKPAALQIHQITGFTYKNQTIVYIDFSAQNDFGGMKKTYFYVSTSSDHENLGWTDAEYSVTLYDASYSIGKFGMIGDPVDVQTVTAIAESSNADSNTDHPGFYD